MIRLTSALFIGYPRKITCLIRAYFEFLNGRHNFERWFHFYSGTAPMTDVSKQRSTDKNVAPLMCQNRSREFTGMRT